MKIPMMCFKVGNAVTYQEKIAKSWLLPRMICKLDELINAPWIWLMWYNGIFARTNMGCNGPGNVHLSPYGNILSSVYNQFAA